MMNFQNNYDDFILWKRMEENLYQEKKSTFLPQFDNFIFNTI